MTETLYFTLAGVVAAPIAAGFSYWWTRVCIRAYRRWTR